jgi:hypothetical protein
MANGISLGFTEDSDIFTVKKFEECANSMAQLSAANYEVYVWFLSEILPTNEVAWLSVFYIGMTSNSQRRKEDALTREFPNQYAGRKVCRIVIKNELTKSAAVTLEASLQSCLGDFHYLPYFSHLF